jgi:hypothetical protein
MLVLIFPVVCFSQSGSYSIKIQELVNEISSDSLKKHLDSLCWANGHQSRITFTPGNYYSAEYIARYFESLPGISSVSRDTFYFDTLPEPYDTYPMINIIATLEGDHPDSGNIIIGGHYDASASRESGNEYYQAYWQTLKAQGADDNASGVAAMMEIARILSDPEHAIQTESTVKFIAFAAEEYHPVHAEYHHIGSLYDALDRYNRGELIKAVIVLDMIAYNPNTDYIEVIADNQSMWLADLIYDINELYTDDLKMNDWPADVPYSDHESYQRYGFSSILLMENDSPWNNDQPYYTSNPYYHKTSDLASTINQVQMRKVTQLALASVADLANAGETTGISSEQEIPDDLKIRVYPNPFNTRVLISITLAGRCNVNAEIFSISGENVAKLADNDVMDEGYNTLHWDADGQASGIYILRINTSRGVGYSKLSLIR